MPSASAAAFSSIVPRCSSLFRRFVYTFRIGTSVYLDNPCSSRPVYTLVYQTLLHVSVPYNAGKDAIVALWDQQAEPFDAEKYMYMATKGPVAFLFVVMTSNLFIYLFFVTDK